MDERHNRKGWARVFETYMHQGSRFFMIHDPRTIHSELFYIRIDYSKKTACVVLGQGVNGKGVVLNLSWFF